MGREERNAPELGVDIFGLLSGRDVVAKDEETRRLVTWNRSLTLQVWYEDVGWFKEEGHQSLMKVPTRDEAEHMGSILLEEDAEVGGDGE